MFCLGRADEKKDWIPKVEREKLTLKRKAEKKEKEAKAAASEAAASPDKSKVHINCFDANVLLQLL